MPALRKLLISGFVEKARTTGARDGFRARDLARAIYVDLTPIAALQSPALPG